MFAVNDYVFYGSGGICKVADVCMAPLEGMPKDRQYYVLHSIHDQNSVMYVPVDNINVFLRALMTKEEAEELIERIPFVPTIMESNSKLLREKYSAAMNSHLPIEWVRVIKTVYLRMNEARSSNRRLSDTERNVYESAKRFLYTELSLALGIPETLMEDHICQAVADFL